MVLVDNLINLDVNSVIYLKVSSTVGMSTAVIKLPLILAMTLSIILIAERRKLVSSFQS